MKKFLDDDFLLSNSIAKELYQNYAAAMPIIDYHCHLSPEEIAVDRRFDNITQMWLEHDHYKWRLMRAKGIDEYFITGDAPDYDKFIKWAETIENAIGNPIYHWSHMELKQYFGCDKILTVKSAPDIWEHCNARIANNDLTARKLMEMSDVKLVITTDDPADDLIWHEKLAADHGFSIKVLPAWRPDKIVNIESESFCEYISRLGCSSGTEITDLNSLKEAIGKRMDYFSEHGCIISDHGILYVPYETCSDIEAGLIFKNALNGQTITENEINRYKTTILLYMAREYKKRGWVMQLHMGALRNNNTKMYNVLGPDSGYDGIYECVPMDQLNSFLDKLDESDMLPKTILYSLNPNDNTMLDVTAGTFNNSDAPYKVQHGAAWWFNDNRDGMVAHMREMANLGLLAGFVGMLTDSRSFLSYTRHDYFRRILCDLIGKYVENGEFPMDMERLGKIVEDVSYYNIKSYLNI